MLEKLNKIIEREILLLKELLSLLDKQYKYVIENNITEMNKLVNPIEKVSEEINLLERARTYLLNGEDIKTYINRSNDKLLYENYREIRKIVNEVKTQKETNLMLLTKGMNFNKRILDILVPKKSTNTYNSKGIIANNR